MALIFAVGVAGCVSGAILPCYQTVSILRARGREG